MIRTLRTHGPVAAPFNFNHPNVSKFSPEVTGHIILKSMAERLGWPSFTGKRVLDYGCGVRLAATIYNLEIDVAMYAGIDVNHDSITWLKQNITDPRFRFEHIDMPNPVYNPAGAASIGASALIDRGLSGFDVAWMHSVITHQMPQDAELIFLMLRPCAEQLYFTAFIDDDVDSYAEGAPQTPTMISTYSTANLTGILGKANWRVDAVHPKSADLLFQQTAFICS